MRIGIALKVFIGFLIIISLNATYVFFAYRLSALNSIAHILKKQDRIAQSFLRVGTLHEKRKKNLLVYTQLHKEESYATFIEVSRTIERIFDTLSIELDSIASLDSVSNGGVYHESPILESLVDQMRNGITVDNKNYINLVPQLSISESPENALQPTIIPVAKGRTAIEMADSAFRQSLLRINETIDKETQQRIKEIESRIGDANKTMTIVVAGTSLFAIIFALLFSGAITRQLRKLKQSAQYIGKGNFYFDPRGYAKDEIGDLATAFFDMALDLKKAQEELVKTKRLAAIGEIVASVNHEINNPLMIISGNAQFLEMMLTENAPEELRERIRIILEETDRISQVTKKLREIRTPVVEDYTSSGEQMINLDKSTRA